MASIAYLNGQYLPLDEARVSVLDRGFLFADGIYEVSAVLDGHLVDNASHLARFERSLGEISLPLPTSMDGIEEIEKELVARNEVREGVVYMQVTRGVAPRDFGFPKDVPPTLLMFTQSKSIVDAPAAKEGIAVKTLADIRWARRDIKSIALLAQVLAKQAAVEAGCQEAWMVEDGFVTEGGSSSAFIVTADNVLVTRPNSQALLPGCTRKAVLALAAEKGVRLEERAFTVAEALSAAEAFITSASSFVMPVVSIDGQAIASGGPGPLTRRLREIYVGFARQSH
jgi:D-alanine transaminase